MNWRSMLAILPGTLLGTSVRRLSIEELRRPATSAGTFTEVAAQIAVGF